MVAAPPSGGGGGTGGGGGSCGGAGRTSRGGGGFGRQHQHQHQHRHSPHHAPQGTRALGRGGMGGGRPIASRTRLVNNASSAPLSSYSSSSSSSRLLSRGVARAAAAAARLRLGLGNAAAAASSTSPRVALAAAAAAGASAAAAGGDGGDASSSNSTSWPQLPGRRRRQQQQQEQEEQQHTQQQQQQQQAGDGGGRDGAAAAAPPPLPLPRKPRGPFDFGSPLRRCTDVILVATALSFCAQWLTRDALTVWGAKVNALIWPGGQWWRLLTPTLLHSGAVHLLINGHALHTLGPHLEAVAGGARLCATYAVSAVAGTALSVALTPAPSVGASASIFGVGAALAVFYHRHREQLGGRAEAVLRSLGLALLINAAYAAANRRVDTWGHVGGAVGGALTAWLLGPRLVVVGGGSSGGSGRTTRSGGGSGGGRARGVLEDRPPLPWLAGRGKAVVWAGGQVPAARASGPEGNEEEAKRKKKKEEGEEDKGRRG